MNIEILNKLGLNDNEIKVYLNLLKKGPSIASEVAKALKLHRTHIYDLLDVLVKKSIISYAKSEGKRYYQAAEPKKLRILLESKRAEIREYEEKLDGLISDLNNVSVEPRQQLLASIFQGRKGFVALLYEIISTLKRGEEYLVLGFTKPARENLKYSLPSYVKKRVKMGIKRRAIIDDSLRNTEITNQALQKVKFLPKEWYVPMGIIVYKDKVVLVITQDTEQIALRIENKKIAESFKKYFEMLWNNVARV